MSLLNKFKNIIHYTSLMGLKWFIFRVKYELLKKIGYFNIVNKSILKKVDRCDSSLFHYEKIGLIADDFRGCSGFFKKADEAINGNIFAFSHEYLNYLINNKIEWQMNPLSKVKADESLSWNNLSDFGEYGDIKLIWEASRFPQVYFFINAYYASKDEKYAKACIAQIVDWIDSNPYPKGVNYKCGQEISFRIFSWINALEYFHKFISKSDEEKIVKNIYTSLLRVDANIDYAAKSVKNNHSISEASGLLLGGLLFPQFKESKEFVKKGLKYLLEESAYQIYDDGSYIQHSFTYERLVLDVLSFVIFVSEKIEFELPEEIKRRHLKILNFLNSFMQENGWLPNYGSNDGTNLFPIGDNDYRDFRGSLGFALRICKKESLLLDKKIEFNDGGYYILKSDEIFTFIRSHSYVDRPGQNDMFHLDVWYKGENIFCDSGSYSYNTDKIDKDNFLGTIGHNTVLINNENQMKQVLNFGWANWTKTKQIKFNKHSFNAQNYAYKERFGITHNRELKLQENFLYITDKIVGVNKLTNIQQVWNTKYDLEPIDEYKLKVNTCIISSNVKYRVEDSYISDYYNSYLIGKRVIFEIDADNDFEIKTVMEFI